MLNKKGVRYTLITILTIIFVVSGAMVVITTIDRQKAKSDFDKLANLVTTPNSEQDNTVSSNNQSNSSQLSENLPIITRDISLLQEMNSECIGWIYIKDTKVNYPVMYTPENPEKYLKRNFYGKSSGSGVPFIDSRCNLKSSNIIIYGHNMKNLTMFGGLRKYLDAKYLASHPIIEFETANGLTYYKIIEVKKTDIYDDWFIHNLNGNRDGKEYLTLSTCYGTNKNARLLVIGVKYNPNTENNQ